MGGETHKAGVTRWWHRLLRAGASGSPTAGGGFWGSGGPDLVTGGCSIIFFEQYK